MDNGFRARRGCARATRLILIAMLGLVPAIALGQPAQDPRLIREAAQAAALAFARATAPGGARVSAEAPQLDPRLRLPACAKPLQALPPTTRHPAARINIQVRCPTPGGWSLYVPVSIKVDVEVVVLAAPAARGEILTAAHLRRERRDVAQLAGAYLTGMDQAEQMVLRRPLPVGAVLTAAALERPKIVKRGQRVRLIAAAAGYSVAAEGEALVDAAEGDRVRVRHLHSRRIVEGVVSPDGQVLVGGSS